jgi:hypothetical protein
MAQIARIWNLKRFGVARGHEVKGMASDILVPDRLCDLRHMTGDAFIAGATGLMMSMRLDARRMRAGLRVGTMTVET